MERIFYRDNEQSFIDVAKPNEVTQTDLIILIHGGYWRVDKTLGTVADIQTYFTKKGYVVCNIEYRRGENNPWPTPSLDVNSAIEKIKQEFPTENYVLIGHSVGGQLALLNAGEQDRVIALAPVTDLIYTRDHHLGDDAVQEYFCEEASDTELVKASPCHHLPLKAASCLLIHGADDVRVDVGTSIRYFQENLAVKNNIELLILPRMAHQEIINPIHDHFSYCLQWIKGNMDK